MLPTMPRTATGPTHQDDHVAELAALAPDTWACLRRGLVGLATAPASDESGRQWRRRVGTLLAPLAAHLRATPTDAHRLIGWLFRHDHTLLEDPATWARVLPGLPRPPTADLDAVVDVALGLPPLPGDEALLRECEARQGDGADQQIIGHPSAYPVIRALARHPRLGPTDEICDLGAGHGRVVLYLAHLGRRARGIELLPDRHTVAEGARRAHRLATARFDQGDVLDARFWRGPAALSALAPPGSTATTPSTTPPARRCCAACRRPPDAARFG